MKTYQEFLVSRIKVDQLVLPVGTEEFLNTSGDSFRQILIACMPYFAELDLEKISAMALTVFAR